MRRPLFAALLGAAAFASVAAMPPPPVAQVDSDGVVVCVRVGDRDIPLTDLTFEQPGDRLCVESGPLPEPLP